MSTDFINKVFSKLDKNGDGDITVSELESAFKLFDKDGIDLNKYIFCNISKNT